MTATRLRIFILGFTAIAIPARASLSFEASQSTFTNQATTTDGLVVSSLFTFTGSLTQFGSVANDEYIDSTTGVEFIAFNGTGTANKAFAPISGGDLNTVANQGDAIEVILPAGTYGLAFNFTTAFSSGDNLCVDTTVSGCSGGAFIAQNGSGFVGTLNDNPTPDMLTTIWMHPTTSAGTNLQSFETATQTQDSAPDAGTMFTLGSGLILIALKLRRYKNSRSFTSIHGR
jgi:hypothetical protein